MHRIERHATCDHEQQACQDNKSEGKYAHVRRRLKRVDACKKIWAIHSGEPKNTRKHRPPGEQNEELMVAPANTITNPRTMMVHAQDADSTDVAMMRALWPQLVANITLRSITRVPTSLFCRCVPLVRGVARAPLHPLWGFWRAWVSARGPKIATNGHYECNVEENRANKSGTTDHVINIPFRYVDHTDDADAESPHLSCLGILTEHR